jgi:FlaG/FlaF family flagellin (archaellin)
MPQKVKISAKLRNNLFVFSVIALSVAIVAVLAATILSHTVGSKSNASIAKSAAESFSGNFSCTADVMFNEKEYEVNINRPSSGVCKMTFNKPEDLKTLSFEKNNDGMKVKFGTLEAAVDAETIPQTAIFNAVFDAFDSCVDSGTKFKASGKDIVISGNSSVGPFTLTVASNMTPKSLSIPSLKFNVTFKNFTYS